MKYLVTFLLVCVLCSSFLAAGAQAGVRDDRPNAVGGELLGRGFVLTLNYERYLNNNFGLGGGVMAIGADDGSVFILPLYASYLPGDRHSLYLGAGLTFLGGGSEFSDYEADSFPTFSIGFQFQSETGFYVRPFFSYMGLKEMDDDTSGVIWPGLSIGGSF